MIRSIHVLNYVVGLAFACSAFTSAAHAQGKKAAAEYIPGTVVSIEKEKTGKNYKLKITKTDDGEELDVSITPKSVVFVTAKGDEGFLKAGFFVEAKATKSPMSLFSDDFTIYIGAVNPPPGITPDKEKPTEMATVMGKIVETQNGSMMIQSGPQATKVEYVKAIVNVKISDPTLIKEGDEVTVEGAMVKSKKVLNASLVTVIQKDPISSAEYLAALDEKRKSKGGTKTKPAAKGKTEPAETEPTTAVPKAKDPFAVGVQPGKKTAKEKADEKKDEAKKDAAAKKDEVKKDEAKKDEVKSDDGKKDEVKKEEPKKAVEKK